MKQMEEFKQLCEQHGIEPEKVNAFFQAIEKNLKNKRYGLVWEKQEEDIEKSLKDRYTVLREVAEREIKLDEGGRTHSLIEGDNLEALTFLKNSGKKVDVIYIDPPYNTTNRDFIYNDDYVDKEDAWRHSKWLSFMNKRLVLARELLTDDGVIFISIDDNELYQLKLLCDSIFGEENFVANLKVNSNPGGNKAKYIEHTQQYCLTYAKKLNNLDSFGYLATNDSKSYKLKDAQGLYKKGPQLEKWGNDSTVKTHPRLAYSIYYNPKTNNVITLYDYNKEEYEKDRSIDFAYENPDEELLSKGYVCIRPRKTRENNFGRWRLEPATFFKRLKGDSFIFEKQQDQYKIYEKDRFVEHKFVKLKDFVDSDIGGQKNELLDIFGSKLFDYPKPISLLKHLVKSYFKVNNVTILDFFAGSGTTAHAVLELNREDGGNRQVILCTNNENNIAEEVTYERIKRVMEGYSTPKGKSVEGIPGNLRYFKVDSVAADEDIYTLEDSLLEVVVPFIQYAEDAWTITTGKSGFTYLDDRVTIYNDPYHLDEDFLDHIKGDTFYIYDGWMDYLDIEELTDIRVVPIPKEFFKLFR